MATIFDKYVETPEESLLRQQAENQVLAPQPYARPKTEFEKGIRRRTLGLKRALGESGRAVAEQLPDQIGDPLETYATSVVDKARYEERTRPDLAARVPMFDEVQNLNDLADWFTGKLSETLADVGIGVGGALAGAAVGGVPGAFAGAATALYPTHFGENVSEAREKAAELGVEPQNLYRNAALTAIPQALLDVGGPAAFLAKAIPREAGKRLLRRVGEGAAIGSVGEGITETTQELLGVKTSLEPSVPGYRMPDDEFYARLREAALAGGALGGFFGGIGGGLAPVIARDTHGAGIVAPGAAAAESGLAEGTLGGLEGFEDPSRDEIERLSPSFLDPRSPARVLLRQLETGERGGLTRAQILEIAREVNASELPQRTKVQYLQALRKVPPLETPDIRADRDLAREQIQQQRDLRSTQLGMSTQAQRLGDQAEVLSETQETLIGQMVDALEAGETAEATTLRDRIAKLQEEAQIDNVRLPDELDMERLRNIKEEIWLPGYTYDPKRKAYIRDIVNEQLDELEPDAPLVPPTQPGRATPSPKASEVSFEDAMNDYRDNYRDVGSPSGFEIVDADGNTVTIDYRVDPNEPLTKEQVQARQASYSQRLREEGIVSPAKVRRRKGKLYPYKLHRYRGLERSVLLRTVRDGVEEFHEVDLPGMVTQLMKTVPDLKDRSSDAGMPIDRIRNLVYSGLGSLLADPTWDTAEIVGGLESQSDVVASIRAGGSPVTLQDLSGSTLDRQVAKRKQIERVREKAAKDKLSRESAKAYEAERRAKEARKARRRGEEPELQDVLPPTDEDVAGIITDVLRIGHDYALSGKRAINLLVPDVGTASFLQDKLDVPTGYQSINVLTTAKAKKLDLEIKQLLVEGIAEGLTQTVVTSRNGNTTIRPAPYEAYIGEIEKQIEFRRKRAIEERENTVEELKKKLEYQQNPKNNVAADEIAKTEARLKTAEALVDAPLGSPADIEILKGIIDLPSGVETSRFTRGIQALKSMYERGDLTPKEYEQRLNKAIDYLATDVMDPIVRFQALFSKQNFEAARDEELGQEFSEKLAGDENETFSPDGRWAITPETATRIQELDVQKAAYQRALHGVDQARAGAISWLQLQEGLEKLSVGKVRNQTVASLYTAWKERNKLEGGGYLEHFLMDELMRIRKTKYDMLETGSKQRFAQISPVDSTKKLPRSELLNPYWKEGSKHPDDTEFFPIVKNFLEQSPWKAEQNFLGWHERLRTKIPELKRLSVEFNKAKDSKTRRAIAERAAHEYASAGSLRRYDAAFKRAMSYMDPREEKNLTLKWLRNLKKSQGKQAGVYLENITPIDALISQIGYMNVKAPIKLALDRQVDVLMDKHAGIREVMTPEELTELVTLELQANTHYERFLEAQSRRTNAILAMDEETPTETAARKQVAAQWNKIKDQMKQRDRVQAWPVYQLGTEAITADPGVTSTQVKSLVSGNIAVIGTRQLTSQGRAEIQRLAQSVPSDKGTPRSGGATGADAAWGDALAKANKQVIHYSFEGHSTKGQGKRVQLSAKELAEADAALTKANQTLQRAYPPSKPFVQKLLQRNYYQVKGADAVYAVADKFQKTPSGNVVVEGGTGWAVQMAVDMGIPAYVYSQKNNKWYSVTKPSAKGGWDPTKIAPKYAEYLKADLDMNEALTELYNQTNAVIGGLLSEVRQAGTSIDDRRQKFNQIREALVTELAPPEVDQKAVQERRAANERIRKDIERTIRRQQEINQDFEDTLGYPLNQAKATYKNISMPAWKAIDLKEWRNAYMSEDNVSGIDLVNKDLSTEELSPSFLADISAGIRAGQEIADRMKQYKQLDSKLLRKTQKVVDRWAKNTGLQGRVEVVDAELVVPKLFANKALLGAFHQGTLHGVTWGDPQTGKISIWLNPMITGSLRREILAHEFGHAIYKGAFLNLSQAEARGVLDQFKAWREKHGKDTAFVDALIRSKKTPAAAANYLSELVGSSRVGEIHPKEAEYLLDFEEWFADEVSRLLVDGSGLRGPVRRFFQRIVNALKKLFGLQTSYKDVGQFVQSLHGRTGATVNARLNPDLVRTVSMLNQMSGVSASMSPDLEAKIQKVVGLNDIKNFLLNKLRIDQEMEWDDPNPPSPAETWAWFTKLHESESDRVALAALSDYAFGALNAGQLEVLSRAARTPAMQMQLRKHLGNDTETVKRLQNGRIAAGEMYALWLQGRIAIGDKTRGVFAGILQKVRDTWGVLNDEEAGKDVMEALTDALPTLRQLQYMGPNAVSLPNPLKLKGMKQKMGPTMTKVTDIGRRTFVDAAETMRSYQISAVDWIVDHFSNKTGQDYRGETLPDAKIRMISRLRNEFIKPFEDKSHEFGREVLDVAYNTKKLSQASPEVQQAFKYMQRTFRKVYEYLKNAGLELGEIKEYFPWVFETDYLAENKQEFYDLLSQQKFEVSLKNLGGGFTWNAVTRRLATLEQLKAANRGRLSGVLAEEYTDLKSFSDKWDKVLPKKRDDHSIIGAPIKNAWATMFDDSANYEWVQARNKYMKTTTDVIDRVYSNIMRNSLDDELTVEEPTFTPSFRSGNVRVLNFVSKVGDVADMDRLAKFFSGDLGLVLDTYINTSVKKAEYTRRFGKKGDELNMMFGQAMEEFGRRIEEQHPDWSREKKAAHIQDFYETLDNYVHAMLGTHGHKTWMWLHQKFGWTGLIPDPNDPENQGKPISPKLQKVINTVMVYQNIRLLALATVSSLIDPIGIAVRTGDMKLAFDSFKSGIRSVWKESRGDVDLQVSLGKMLGIIDTNLTNEALGWEYGGVYMTGWQRKLNEGFFKWTGLQWWTRSTRVMALHAGMRFLAYHKNLPKKHSERWLTELGVKPDDIVLDENGDLKFHTMKDRETASKAEIDRDDRVKHAVFRFVDESILRPTAAYRPIWASDQHYALFFHLKSFMYTFHDRYVRRVIHEMEEGNYLPLLALTSFVPAMMAAELLRDMIQHGGTPPRKAHWGMPEYMMNGLTRSGVPGITLVGFDAASDIEYGGWGFESWAGPTVQQLLNPDPLKALPMNNLWRGWLPGG